jgi:phosphoribosyl-ATP pyrophosphohydrolase
MAKKLGEEAVEVVIEAIAGDSDAVARESADLLYNLVVLWTACGLRPSDIWAEMDRRERMLGIAEKMPKSDKAQVKQAKSVRPVAIARAAVPARRLRGIG